MARDQESMTDEEIEQHASRWEEIRADLAEKLGGKPEDYNAEKVISEATANVSDSDK